MDLKNLNDLGLIFRVFHLAVVLDVCNFELNETKLLKKYKS